MKWFCVKECDEKSTDKPEIRWISLEDYTPPRGKNIVFSGYRSSGCYDNVPCLWYGTFSFRDGINVGLSWQEMIPVTITHWQLAPDPVPLPKREDK
jgi:hypothetical protein